MSPDIEQILGDVTGWFPVENREELERLIHEHNVRTVVEVGTFLGLSAIWFAARVERVVCVDRWYEPANAPNGNNLVSTLEAAKLPKDFFDVFRNNVLRAGVQDKIFPIRGDSNAVHELVEEADLVYIDADHSFEGCSSDIRLYAPKARKVVCGDDYLVWDSFRVIEAVKSIYPEHKSRGRFWWVVK